METLKEIVQRDNFLGFVGEKCYHCGATYNIELWSCGYAIGPPGFSCSRCGEFIVMSLHPCGFTFKKPDFGWKRTVLGWAITNFARYKDYLKRTHLWLIEQGMISPDKIMGYKLSKRKG